MTSSWCGDEPYHAQHNWISPEDRQSYHCLGRPTPKVEMTIRVRIYDSSTDVMHKPMQEVTLVDFTHNMAPGEEMLKFVGSFDESRVYGIAIKLEKSATEGGTGSIPRQF